MNRSQINEILLPAGALAVAFIAYILTSGKIADHDAFVMGEVAQRLAAGKLLYLEAWDNKPPLALLFYYPSQALAPGSYLAQQVFTFLWTAAQALATFILLRGEKLWIRGVIAILVLWAPLMRTDFAWGSSEDAVNGFTILLAVLGYRVFRDGNISLMQWLICGMAAVFALHARQPGVLFLALPLAALAASPQTRQAKLRALAGIAGGGIIAFAAVVGIMLLISDWTSYLSIMVKGPMHYSGAQQYLESKAAGGAAAGTQLATGSALPGFKAFLIEKLLVIRNVLLEHFTILGSDILFVFPVLAVVFNTGRRWRMIAALFLGTGLAAVLLPMKLFSHYHQQLIPVFAIGTLFLLRRLDEVSAPLAKSLAIGLLGILLLKVGLTAEALRYDNGEKAEMAQVIRLIEAESRPAERLFTVGRNSAYIYYRSHIPAVHKIHWDLFFGWLSRYLPVNIATVMDEITTSPPAWIVIDRNDHEKYLLRPDPAGEGDVRIGELLRRLDQKYHYEMIQQVGRWRVLRRVG